MSIYEISYDDFLTADVYRTALEYCRQHSGDYQKCRTAYLAKRDALLDLLTERQAGFLYDFYDIREHIHFSRCFLAVVCGWQDVEFVLAGMEGLCLPMPEDIRQAALCAGYTAQSAFRMGQRALKNPEVRTQALWHGAPVPDETAEETLQRRIAAMMRGGELKAGEQFRAMEMLYKLEKQRGQAGEERVKTVRFEGALEQWSR